MHLRECKELDKRDDNVLVVGVVSDNVAESYKRRPLYDEKHRSILIGACRYVDEVIDQAPLVLTSSFIRTHNIDIVCHGFSTEEDTSKQSSFFKVPIELGIFRPIPYHYGISTTLLLSEMQKECKGV